MSRDVADVVQEFLQHQRLDDIWWGAKILDAWPHVVGSRFAAKAQPLLEKSPIQERGLLTIAVPNSAWLHELSFLNIGDRMNDALGRRVIRHVRFELRGLAT